MSESYEEARKQHIQSTMSPMALMFPTFDPKFFKEWMRIKKKVDKKGSAPVDQETSTNSVQAPKLDEPASESVTVSDTDLLPKEIVYTNTKTGATCSHVLSIPSTPEEEKKTNGETEKPTRIEIFDTKCKIESGNKLKKLIKKCSIAINSYYADPEDKSICNLCVCLFCLFIIMMIGIILLDTIFLALINRCM